MIRIMNVRPLLTPSRPRGLNSPALPITLFVKAFSCVATLLAVALPSQGVAQVATSDRRTTILDSLVTFAVARNPAVRAAQHRADAMRARIAPAGTRPDPMLMLGVQNFTLTEPGFSENMTMKMIGVSQTIPYSGKLGLERRVASLEVAASEAMVRAAALDVANTVKNAYYEIAFIDRAIDVVEQNRDVLVDLIKVTDARYRVGQAMQQDILSARVEAGRLAEQAVMLREQRHAELASLNAALDRPSETPLTSAQIPERIARAAVPESATTVRFVSSALGARAADSPLPPLTVLQAMALETNPQLIEQDAMIAAQQARVARAQKEHLPDFDVALSYGQRTGFRDMITATVSIPIRLNKRNREDQLLLATQSDLSALELERSSRRNMIRADVARLSAELERQRAQLALFKTAIIPQGRAAWTSALASYQAAQGDLLTLLTNQATIFNYETEYFRVLADFAKTLAEMERVVGTEVLK